MQMLFSFSYGGLYKMFLGAAAATVMPATIPGWLVAGAGILGIAKAVSRIDLSRERFANVNIDAVIDDAFTSCIQDVVQQIIAQVTGEVPTFEVSEVRVDGGQHVNLDFDAMDRMYEQYGARGLYAYLVSNGIAKDKYHGDFLIEDIFLPERERRMNALAGAVIDE